VENGNHNKKGHAQWVERQQQEQRQIHGENSKFDISEIVEVNNHMLCLSILI
jgi:hypothetical protein